MEINKNKAVKLWNDVFGENTLWAVDCFGTWIYKEDYGNSERKRKRPNGDGKEYSYCWNVDHIKPIAEGGKDEWNNYEPMHCNNNFNKGDKISFKINGTPYQTVRCDLSNGYGIQNQNTGKRVDWKAVQNRWYV